MGQFQFLGKIATHLPHFHLLTPPLKWSILHIPPIPFYYNNSPPCPPTLLQWITFSPGKVSSSIRVYILRTFFQNAISSLTKHKKCFLETSYRSSQISKLELFTTRVPPYMLERVLNNTNSYFDESCSP